MDEHIPTARYVETRFNDYVEAHKEVHTNEKESIRLAMEDLNRWKESHNEWQRQMKDAQSRYITRDEYTSAHITLSKTVDTLSKLVYIGVGMSIVIQVMLRLFAK